jgi:hypothetical protein
MALEGATSSSAGVPAKQRTIFINRSDLNSAYRTNKTSNTKYTPWTFLPRMLVDQFSTPMQLYFLMIACLQLWRTITPVSTSPLFAIFC